MSRLAERLASGDCSAFTELYDDCANKLHHYLTSRLGSRDDASGVLQEVFLRLVRLRERFADVRDPVAYAFGVARNEAMRCLSKSARRSALVKASAKLLFIEATCGEVELQELSDLAANALNRLDDHSREVVFLKIYAEMTFAQIAEVLEIPQGTAASRYRRAILSLRDQLAKELL